MSSQTPHLLVLLPPRAAGLCARVRAAGGTPVIDLSEGGQAPSPWPEGAWVRIQPGQEPVGEEGVLLTGSADPVPGRSTWLESAEPMTAPEGIEGIVLRGREAGGFCGEQDGLEMLALQKGSCVLEAGLGPDTAASAVAMGAAGVLIREQLYALPELLGPHLRAKALRSGDLASRVVAGVRVTASSLSPIVRRLAEGEDPHTLWASWDRADDDVGKAFPAGQGLALAAGLLQRHESLEGILRAYSSAMSHARARAGVASAWTQAGAAGRSLSALRASNGTAVIATTGGNVGSGVLWQLAAWEGLPVAGAPLVGALATGQPVAAPISELEAARAAFEGDVASAPPQPAAPVLPDVPMPLSEETGPSNHSGEAIAIVGLGCVLPDSPDIDTFWENLRTGRNSIIEVPKDRWDADLYWVNERGIPDRTYSKIGGFVRDFKFKAREFRIPPKMASFIDQVQQMTLVAVKEALEDAGLGKDAKVDRSRIAVILGNAMGGNDSRDKSALRIYTLTMREVLSKTAEVRALPQDQQTALLNAFEADFRATLPPITEDSMPGELSNVVAGRVTNAFDLGGPNFTVDAACASSMAAIQSAMKGLQDGDYDVAVTGGADRSMDAPTYAKFSAIGALSHDRSSPFDAGANGFVMGEGAGILVLKRLSDAERDGDKVYAVLRGMGASSDGKGKGITAPNIEGQRRALRRAYAEANLDPVEVDLVECHGTSTVVGDKIEATALSDVIGSGRRGARGPIRIGSVKSQIGHLKSAAGAASVIKVALALHHKVLLPSINYRTPREDLPMGSVPLQVQSQAEPWETHGWTRYAGVSAFGFGGTNFHAVLQEHQPRAQAPKPVSAASVTLPKTAALPDGIWATSGRDVQELLANLDKIERGEAAPWNPSLPLRVSAAFNDRAEQLSQIEKIRKAAAKGKGWELLRMRNIHLEDTPADGKLAFCFTGQGSQYLGMGLDLFDKYPLVAGAFAEADEIAVPELGRSLIDYIKGISEDPKESFIALRATEIAQPVTMAMDIGLLRVLSGFGLFPDMVAGHSLGEYPALVAAGVTDYHGAMQAVTARGKEMAGIKIEDPGAMAGVAASAEVVSEVLAEVEGYVIAANKNSPKQTVIAGATLAVEAASEVFRSRDITVVPLPVSHAFHSAIVAPASAPLKKVLQRVKIVSPVRPITSNVTSRWYPTDPVEIIDLLSKQVAAPVEWVNQVERMYAEGARIFVEIGPKRALAGMISTILKGRPHRAFNTNHPKVGGERSLRDALAALIVLGFPLKQSAGTEIVDYLQDPRPRLATSEALALASKSSGGQLQATPFVIDTVKEAIARRAGLDADSLENDLEMEADLGIDTVRQAELVAELRTTFKLERESGFLLSDHNSIRDLVDYFASRLGQFEPRWDRSAPAVATQPRGGAPAPAPRLSAPTAEAIVSDDAVARFLTQAAKMGLKGADAELFAQAMLPMVQNLLEASFKQAQRLMPPSPVVQATQALQPMPQQVRVVCTGASVGLPGGTQVFDDDNIASILRGDNRITPVDPEYRKRFLDKNIVRVVKDASGQGSFLPVENDDQVIRLAGQAQHFDVGEYGVPERLSVAFDRATQLAIAAGLEALRDAQIPLVRTYHETSTGKKVPTGWALPEPLRDETGVIFASAFPGYNLMAEKLTGGGLDANGHFDRRFLFQVLAMGHSQFAQLVGARGPNTQVNSACASTTQAVGLAQDWIRLGRCKRVIIVGADDVTSPALLEWMGSGFLAAGAATTEDKVENAALPFDARRHGMILGMGAVGMIIETEDAASARGIVPIAELVNSSTANSAFHGTRLNLDHIAEQVATLVAQGAQSEGITPAEMGRQALFMSHETYTPARGGSSAAEIAALRAAFGASANQVIITNTKGFTGHPMGAGIEDAIAIKALQYGRTPPIPNLLQPDPELGDLNLSKGGSHRAKYALRLAAGFGSQLSLGLWRKIADGDQRVANASVQAAWLSKVTGIAKPELVLEDRTLKAKGEVVEAKRAAPAAAPKVIAAAPVAAAPKAAAPAADVLTHLMGVIGEKTGYGPEDLDPDYELEADLGIDTVKQAEIFSEVRDHYGIGRDDSFSLADYPTVRGLAGWLSAQMGGEAQASDELASLAETVDQAAPAEAAEAPAAGVDHAAVLSHLLNVIGEKTGYEEEDLDPDYELEADLGIDTVKQAEIFSEVRDHYGIARDDTFSLADYPTVRALSGWLSSQMGAVPVSAPAEVPTPAAPASAPVVAPQASAVSAEDVLKHLLDVISEKTGYEHEDLDPEYELEADLGIDTVKQAEIFSEVRDHYGVERDDSFSLADYSTIAALAGWLGGQVAKGGGAPAAPTPVAAAPEAAPVAPAAAEGTLEAQAPVTRSAEVLEMLLRVVGEKTGYEREDLDLDYELEADLGIDTVKQAEIFSEVRDHFGVQRDDSFSLADYPTLGSLAEWLGERVTSGSTGPLPEAEDIGSEENTSDPMSELPPTFWIRRPVRLSRPLSLEGSLQGRVVMVLGDGPVADAMVEALSERGAIMEGAEGAGSVDAVVDVAADVISAFRLAKSHVETGVRDWICLTMMGELDGMTPDQAFFDGSRAGFTKALGREWEDCSARVVDVSPQLEPERIAELLCQELAAHDGTVEVFHGYEGLRTVIELAVEDHPPAMARPRANQVVIVTGGGRGVTARVAAEFARRAPATLVLVGRSPAGTEPLDEKAEKNRIRAELKAAGERATPAQIERQLNRLRKAEEIRLTVEELRGMGSTAEYRTCDMADTSAVRDLVAEVQNSYGRIDGCIHGAGVEESRLIQDKDEDAFHRVFDGKAVGGLTLVEAMGPDAWFLSMGSVAGRFGNAGQVDYSAANEAMAQICLSRPHSIHVDWTAWGGVGMAVRGGMQNLLEARGVELLPAQAGASLAVDLIAAGVEGEVVVAGKLGELVPSPNHPLLDSVEHEGDIVVARYTLDQDRAPWILDHAIDKVPVLPGVMGLELMAAAASLARPGLSYVGVADVVFEKPVKLYRGEPCELEMRARPTPDGRVECVLVSERVTRAGKRLRSEHFRATVLLEGKPELSSMPPAFFPEESISRGEIYRRFFHGPAFQVLRGADAVTRDGLAASARVEHSYIAEGLMTSPLALEAAFQAAGLHAMVAQDVLALPASVDTVWMAREVRDGEDLTLTAQLRDDGAYDVDVNGEDGRLMSVRGFRMVEKGPLPDRERFTPPEEGWEESAFGSAVVVSGPAGPDAALGNARVGEDPSQWLSGQEIALLRARGTAKRQADRIAGRIAAKRAVCQLTGAEPGQVDIRTLASGAPSVLIHEEPGPLVSISHSGGHAVAWASRRERVGVDLEQVEARHPSFVEEWFSEQESALLAGDPYRVTVAWSAKEAVLKALGQGMALNPREIQVLDIQGPEITLRLDGEVARAHEALGGAPFSVSVQQTPAGVLVRASFAA